ncbi:hypothetical protein ACFL2V_02945 [Pseudomonadota bacterium]
MRKKIINTDINTQPLTEDQTWLDLEQLAQVELTSEDKAHPVESALITHDGTGWRAQHPGKQTIRLRFDTPLKISTIQLLFQESEQERTQEFLLSWSTDGGVSMSEIVRQQYNFSQPTNTREFEEYNVELNGVTLLELSIIPNISGGETRASLAQLRLA